MRIFLTYGLKILMKKSIQAEGKGQHTGSVWSKGSRRHCVNLNSRGTGMNLLQTPCLNDTGNCQMIQSHQVKGGSELMSLSCFSQPYMEAGILTGLGEE